MGTLHEALCTFIIMYCWILLRMRNASDRPFGETQKHTLYLSVEREGQNTTVGGKVFNVQTTCFGPSSGPSSGRLYNKDFTTYSCVLTLPF
jgi:hypothetical protein